jgi:hypothetical protein
MARLNPGCGRRRFATLITAEKAVGKGAEGAPAACGRGGVVHYHLAVPAADTIPPRVRRLVAARDGGWCARCGTVRELHQHHRRIKGSGGDPRPHTDCACNIITLCTGCHEWAHRGDRRRAEAEGLIVPRAETAPGRVSVMIGSECESGMTVWLACDDDRYSMKPPERAA